MFEFTDYLSQSYNKNSYQLGKITSNKEESNECCFTKQPSKYFTVLKISKLIQLKNFYCVRNTISNRLKCKKNPTMIFVEYQFPWSWFS